MEGQAGIASVSTAGRGRRRWHFGIFVLDETTRELISNGAIVDLERKPLEVLIYLLQHAGEVCTKDELLAGVWPRRVLSETVLTKSIGRLRDVLDDRNQEVIKTAYGFGYRLAVPVRIELTAAPEPARLNFREGDHPPNRPLWRLVERLGVGGHGEVWRCRHEKTREQRVFKFALNEDSLGALKREITLFRVINDSLRDARHVVKLLDWNLEQFPYFIEAEYIPGGNLVDWARTRGGLAAIPIEERLEIVAKIASALAAVHSVGVLHKDLKPSNVLVRVPERGSADVLVADFGSGAVLDVAELERMGITRLGFTKTIAVTESTSGTPLYLAPEVLHGQPFTVKSDLFALGVILYQMISCDFHKIMAPGWERDVEDELLREDIALLAEGNPAMRLTDADTLARRLRTLPERRQELVSRRDAEERAERVKRLLERAQARRFGLLLAIFALAIGLAASTLLYFRAREAQLRSEASATRARTVVEFLGNDVFAPVSTGKESVKDMTVTTLLARAGKEVDSRFAREPEIASQLHFVLGRSFNSFYESPLALAHFRRALELGQHLSGEGSEAAVHSASELVTMDYVVGNLRSTYGEYQEVLAAGEKALGPTAPAVLDLRLRLARGDYLLGNWSSAAAAMGKLLADTEPRRATDSALLGEINLYYGQMLTDLANSTEARRRLTNAVEQLTGSLGERHGLVADARAALGRAQAESGDYAAADAELKHAAKLATDWAAPESWTELRPRYFRALMYLSQDKAALAEPILAQIVDYQDANVAAYLAAHKGLEPELDHTGPVRTALASALARQGKWIDAISVLRRSVEVSERADGANHPAVVASRLALAECLAMNSRDDEAKSLLDDRIQWLLPRLPAIHPIAAESNRVSALLAEHSGARQTSRELYRREFEIYRTLYGAANWRTVRASADVERLSLPGA